MKFIGICLLIIATTGIGQHYSLFLSKRIRRLEEIQILIGALRTELTYRLTPLNELIRNLAGRKELAPLEFLSACNSLCFAGEPFPDAWQSAVMDKRYTDALSQEDIELLLSFGAGLGTTDLSGQCSLCDLHETMLDDHLGRAREAKKKYGRLYTNLGLLAGLAVAVLIW